MEQIELDIKTGEEILDPPLSAEALENAVFVEDASHALRVSHITVSGKYTRAYKIVAFCVPLTHENVMVDNDLLIVCLREDLLLIDLKADKLLRVVPIRSFGQLFGIYKFKSGYFIHGELTNYFLNEKFEIVWEAGCADIFYNPHVEKVLEIFDDYITVFDWFGGKHFYNENGEF